MHIAELNLSEKLIALASLRRIKELGEILFSKEELSSSYHVKWYGLLPRVVGMTLQFESAANYPWTDSVSPMHEFLEQVLGSSDNNVLNDEEFRKALIAQHETPHIYATEHNNGFPDKECVAFVKRLVDTYGLTPPPSM